jgi:hypothetical protein
MLGDRGLRYPELFPDGLADRAGAQLTVGEQLQNPAAHGVTEYVEYVHAPSVSIATYISDR